MTTTQPLAQHPLAPRTAYAELHCYSNYTFLKGASHPEELVERAAELGYSALAITDECSVAGVVKAHVAAKSCQLKLIIGSSFTLEDQTTLILLAKNRRGYGQLCQIISQGRRRSVKGHYQITVNDFPEHTHHLCAIWCIDQRSPDLDPETIAYLKTVFEHDLWLGAALVIDAFDL